MMFDLLALWGLIWSALGHIADELVDVLIHEEYG
jgi:hypothetical protein